MSIDYGDLLGRAWRITWQNRSLWILGFLIALTSGSGGGGGGGGSTGGGGGSSGPNLDFSFPEFWAQYGALIIAVGVFLVLLLIALSFVRAAAEASLIAAADAIERSGESVGAGAAWRMGSSKTLQMWLLLLVTGLLAVVLAVIVILPFALTILSAATMGFGNASIVLIGGGLVLTCGLLPLLVAAIIAIALIEQYAKRGLVLEDQGVLQSLGAGWSILRRNFVPSLVTGLILLLVQGVVAIVELMVLLPIGIAGFLMVLPVLQSGAFAANLALIIGVIVVGVPVILVISALVGAVPATFTSVVWTELYLRLRGLVQGADEEMAPAGS